MSKPVVAFIVMLLIAAVSACAAPTDSFDGSERVASTSSALGGGSSVPYPVKTVGGTIQYDPNGNAIPHWTGTIVDVMAADAWAQCGAHVASAAELATDQYLTYLETKIDQATCPGAIAQTPPPSDFSLVGCGTTVSACPSKVKRWARQRQIASCNVDTSTRLSAVVTFYGNGSMGHTLPSSAFSAFPPSTALTGAIAAAQKEVDIAEVNLCIAQRLRENMASADSLFLSAPDLRQLLEVIRERAQISMTQYALLARVFTNPHDPPGAPAYPTQAFVTLKHWSQQTSAEEDLRAMGTELGAAVQLNVDATRELAQLLVRSASARVDRAGAPTSNPQSDFGTGSWRQRLLSLLYGGNPLRGSPTPGEIDPVGISSSELNAQLEAIETSVPWETAWTEDINGVVTLPFPNWLPPLTPAQRYARTPTADPHLAQLLGLARKADAFYLKELNGDFVHTAPPLFGGGSGTLTARRIDVDASAPLVWALVEAWLRTEDCRKTNPTCTIGVNHPTMPATDAYATSLLWKKYGVQPSHAAALVSMLADVVPLQSEGGSAKWWFPSAPSVPYEQAGALHVTGASRTLNSGELAERLPGHGSETWYRLDPEFNVVPFGNRERAPLYTAQTKLFAPRSFDKLNLPAAQGFGQGTAVRRLGAISALTLVRNLLEDSVAGASANLAQTYLAKVPRALAMIGAAIGEQSISVRPSTVVQDLFRNCGDLDPLAPTVRACPTVIQTSSTDGLTARWNVSVRTDVADPFFAAGAVSLVIVPFQGGIETAASLDPTYGSFKGATRATLLESSARVEVALSAPTTLGTTAVQREATVDLPVLTALSGYFLTGGDAAFSVFLKRTASGETKYQLLAQQLNLQTNIASRAVGDGSTSALIGLPSDGQFMAYGGVLGQMGARAWVTREGDWSKPAYDGFGVPTDWVPPFDPALAGAGADDASATYLRHARAAADEATNAVQRAIDELLREQADGATLANAQRRASGIAQLEQRALCGDAKPDCDTSFVEVDLGDYFPPLACLPGNLCTNAQLMRNRVVPSRVRLAKSVYEQRFAHAPPAFNEYAGGKLQGVLIEQWAALRKLKQLVEETAANVESHRLQIAAAEVEKALAYAQLGQAYAVQKYECSDETMMNAFEAGKSFADQEYGDDFQWSPGALIAQQHACELAKKAIDPGLVYAQLASHVAKQEAIVAQAWSWLAAQSTLLLDAGAALQISGANLAKGLQDTNLAKAQAQLEAMLAVDTLQTKFGTYRRYHSYDVWRARGLLESTRRYAVAARRAIEARYVVDLSEMRSDEPFVAAPATWADEIYEYDLAAPASVGLTAIPTSGGGIYPNRLVDYVGNLERFVNGYAVARPTAIAQLDDELFHVPGPDVRVNGVLSGEVAGWEFRCPNGSWVTHPGFVATTPNASITTICGGVSPTRARVSFTLDPWGRLNGHVPDAPYAQRHNARWLQLAVNFVGTGLRNCAIAADPNGCYANAYLRYNLTHAGPAWVTNFDEQWRALGVPVGNIEGAKALTAEQWLDPTGNGFSKPYVASVARTELAGRPVGGTYQLELEVTPDVRLDRIDRVQVLTRSTYWVKQGQSSPPNTAPQPSVFDPATLPLTGWWRASYGGSSWVGTASAGASGSRNASEATTPPAVGSLVNALAPADFDGSNDRLTLDGADIGAYYATSAYSGWALVKANVVNTNGDNSVPFANDAILATTPSGYWAAALRESGAVQINHFTTTAERKVPSAPFAVGQWQLVQWKYDGTYVKLRVNNGTWVAVAAANQELQNAFRMGLNYQGDAFLDGDILEMALSNAAISDTDFDKVLTYCETRYGLTLTTFNPATLSLTGWWRGPFRQSPWVGQISAGGSGGRDLTEAANAPSAGTALNGIAPAAFNGTNDELTPGGTTETYYNNNAYSGWALVKINAITTDEVHESTGYANDQIIAGTAGYTGVSLRSTGPTVGLWHFDGAQKAASTAIATGSWQLVQWKYDGTNLKIRVNSGAWASAAAGNIDATGMTQVMRPGRNYNGTAYTDIEIADLALTDSALSDGTFDNIKSYINARYGLAL